MFSHLPPPARRPQAKTAASSQPPLGAKRYAELHCRTNFSFLKGASHPHELVARAAEIGLSALAITDISGVYGIVRAWEALRELPEDRPLHLIYGSELQLQVLGGGESLVVLARDRDGYAKLCQLISRGRLRADKGECLLGLEELLEAGGEGLIVLVGGPRSRLLRWLRSGEVREARRQLGRMQEALGDALYLELTRHHRPGDIQRSRAVAALGRELAIPLVATNDVHFHRRARKPLHDVLTCIDAGITLDAAGWRLLPNAERTLKSPEKMCALFTDLPAAIAHTLEIAERCIFDLRDLHYAYPNEALREGESADEGLERLAREGLTRRVGVERARALTPQLQKELRVIAQLGYAGYFLTMWEIVQYCARRGILCQGRGSAANSLVCYATGITAVSPDQIDMLFERFISLERSEPPDIDLDIEHDRREEVIQHVYRKYGRERAAMVAEIIRYRMRSALREVGKAFGLPEHSLVRASRLLSDDWHRIRHSGCDQPKWVALQKRSGSRESEDVPPTTGFQGIRQAARSCGLDPNGHLWQHLIRLASELEGFPRHLSIHVGGFVLASEPVARLVPLENARMAGRTVIQWDKDDIDALGIFKVDLLGLGMLNVIARTFSFVAKHHGKSLDLGNIPPEDPPTYEMIRRADTVGVFQIESRAQMGMLPRLLPRTYYDLVVQVAIVRPGPIQGGMVHPYLRRRSRQEPVEYPHPKLEPILQRTLGVPIFQEQVMRIAVELGHYTPGEADQLRRDMAAWRRRGKMQQHQARLYRAMRAQGIAEEFAERIVRQIEGFGSYGFPESHAAAFAHLVYVSAYLKCHYPVAFAAALINAQPMGFYQVATIVSDLHRHGIPILGVDVQHSDWEAQGEKAPKGSTEAPLALRLGLRLVRGLSEATAERIVADRQAKGPFTSIAELAQRCLLARHDLTQLALAGALRSLAPRREALWQSTALGGNDLTANALDEPEVTFDPLQAVDEMSLDYHFAQSFVEGHPLRLYRSHLQAEGILCATELKKAKPGSVVEVAGLVLVRQRPGGPGHILFMALEDETGLIDVVVKPDTIERYRSTIFWGELLRIRGRLQVAGRAHNLLALSLRPLPPPPSLAPASELPTSRIRSRDFH